MPPVSRLAAPLLAGLLLAAAGGTARAAPPPGHAVAPPQTWTATQSMSSGRDHATATLLEDGRVLVAGGVSNGTVLPTAELYDPGSGRWRPTGVMASARYAATATRLRDGRVLIAGGIRYGVHLASAELYDPASGSWTPTGGMMSARALHTATLLGDGQVLVAGGFDGHQELASTELFDPDVGRWRPGMPMTSPRIGHTATRLPDGRVLVVGGIAQRNVPLPITPKLPIVGVYTRGPSAEIYTPVPGSWLATQNTTVDRVVHAARHRPPARLHRDLQPGHRHLDRGRGDGLDPCGPHRHPAPRRQRPRHRGRRPRRLRDEQRRRALPALDRRLDAGGEHGLGPRPPHRHPAPRRPGAGRGRAQRGDRHPRRGRALRGLIRGFGAPGSLDRRGAAGPTAVSSRVQRRHGDHPYPRPARTASLEPPSPARPARVAH
ncbi:MAG: hypothetical protein E6I76_18305 [Chloroflexi bacterium]|nr:MAG: hypothetical protein E6I76_18305 [Chloroflexota bacterium]